MNLKKGTKAYSFWINFPGISIKTARACAEYERKGYKIKYTVDSYFLRRHPMGKQAFVRTGILLGTGSTGKQGHSVFAYKEIKK